MLQTEVNRNFSQAMDLFNEIDDLSDLFFLEKHSKIDSVVEENEDLQSKYSNLHENYAREIENSKKVEKCLVKCLKFYSKLCKKYEVQQKLIKSLEESIKEKVDILEEAQKNEERMKGLIQVYRTERTLYAGETNSQLRKDKELLLDICCQLIGESIKNDATRNLSQLILRKFKKDLDDEKINMLKGKQIKLKNELDLDEFEISKPDFTYLKDEIEFKPEGKLTKVEIKEVEEDTKNYPLDLSLNKAVAEESDCLCEKHLIGVNNKEVFVENEQNTLDVVSSLPFLEEVPEMLELNKKKSQNEDSVNQSPRKEDSDLGLCENSEKSDVIVTPSESLSPHVPILFRKDSAVLMGNKAIECPIQLVERSTSLFDVSFSCLKVSNCRTDLREQKSVAAESEGFSGISFDAKHKPDDPKTNETNVELSNFDGESDFSYEEKLFKIFREMSSVRLLSPIRECSNLSIASKSCTVTINVDKNRDWTKSKSSSKRNSNADGNPKQMKKLRREEEKSNSDLLDSIMSAMSIQNEEFKAKGLTTKEIEARAETSFESASPSKRTFSRSNSSLKENLLSPKKKEINRRAIEKIVMQEIKNFVLSPISSKEDADKNVKHCFSVLSNKSEDVIARCIVAIILENIDEAIEVFERPSPPLTRTQHRLIVLLSVFRTLHSNFESISNKILSIISEKLFPDNFFWPDDCVEAAARFYAALCRARNDPITLWKFCLHGMTEMKQRCPLLMLTVLKTWPDVLHDASTLKNNMLAVTTVNIFLHMPKKEGLRNFNQGRKLIALKHLLLNFYQFKVEDTIEGYAKKVLDSVFREEPGSEKSIVLLSKCRDQSWTVKNVLPFLKSKLLEWAEGRVEDSIANRILSVIKQISPSLQGESVTAKLKDIGLCLSEILTSGKKNHDSEVNIIEVLLQLKQYPEVRKIIREWIPKNSINDGLRNEIINASAENILRELKLNRRRETKNASVKKKLKKQPKKSKKKKTKGKKIQKNYKKSKVASAGVSS